jgi:hypothetical protein
MNDEKTLKHLQQQNIALRLELNNLLRHFDDMGKKTFWNYMNDLIENEIEQEELCS